MKVFRLAVVLLGAFLIAAIADAAPRSAEDLPPASPLIPPKDAAVKPATPGDLPRLLIYLAKGSADACGQGCNSWIAIEGDVDADAAATVERFLRDVTDTRLPFYFHSLGGEPRQGMAIGRMLRQRKAIGRVGQTVVAACPGKQLAEPCRKIKIRGESEARIVTRNAKCNSACVDLLLGATTREVPVDAEVGVHDARVVVHSRGHLTAGQLAEVGERGRRQLDREHAAFLAEMGISRDLFDLMKTVKFEDGRPLTRGEIYRFGIDSRSFAETPWRLDPDGRATISKSAVARTADGSSFRRLEWWLSCAGSDSARMRFLREFDNNASGTATVAIVAGSAILPNLTVFPERVVGLEAWDAVMSAADMTALVAPPRLQINETRVAPDGRSTRSALGIDTGGLAVAWSRMAAICATAPLLSQRPVFAPPAWPPASASVPFNPAAVTVTNPAATQKP